MDLANSPNCNGNVRGMEIPLHLLSILPGIGLGVRI